MFTNFLLLLLICAIGGSHNADLARCSNGTESEQTSFTSYENEVAGRYLFERCLDLEPEVTSWTVHVSFFNTDTRCKHPPYRGIHVPGRTHSDYEQTIVRDGNCSHVCLNTTFDLIFAACYCIESTFMIDGHSRYINYSYFNIFNNYTMDNIITNQAQVSILNQDDENVTIEWHTGVPFDDFDILICDWDNVTDAVADDGRCARVGRAACRAGPAGGAGGAGLACAARLAPGRCHQLRLTLHAAWAHGLFTKQGLVLYDHCAGAGAGGRGARAGARVWPWAGALGGAGLLLAAAAARALCRGRRARALHKAVLKEWLVRRGIKERSGRRRGRGRGRGRRRARGRGPCCCCTRARGPRRRAWPPRSPRCWTGPRRCTTCTRRARWRRPRPRPASGCAPSSRARAPPCCCCRRPACRPPRAARAGGPRWRWSRSTGTPCCSTRCASSRRRRGTTPTTKSTTSPRCRACRWSGSRRWCRSGATCCRPPPGCWRGTCVTSRRGAPRSPPCRPPPGRCWTWPVTGRRCWTSRSPCRGHLARDRPPLLDQPEPL